MATERIKDPEYLTVVSEIIRFRLSFDPQRQMKRYYERLDKLEIPRNEEMRDLAIAARTAPQCLAFDRSYLDFSNRLVTSAKAKIYTAELRKYIKTNGSAPPPPRLPIDDVFLSTLLVLIGLSIEFLIIKSKLYQRSMAAHLKPSTPAFLYQPRH